MTRQPNVTPSEAAAALGRIKSERKTQAARENAKRPRRPMSEETKAKIRSAWAKKREENEEQSV